MVKLLKTLDQWLTRLETSHNKKIDLGLDRVKSVYQHLKLNKIAETVITVAGTNGKGSTVAILNSICQQSGLKVGAFTSPHLLKFNERISINGVDVSDDDIINAFEMIQDNLYGITLSYFEYATLAALIIFKKHKVDVALLEVGLGGRLDSVNVVDSDCAIITTIDIDHTEWLGDDIESIAYEKAGIMRPNKPVVYGDKNCPQSIIDYAHKIKAILKMANQDIDSYETNLLGQYQQANIKTAITALKTLPLPIQEAQIQAGLKNVKLSGRLQTISNEPEVIIDVSHNKQAAQSLAKWLKNNPIKGKTIAVFAVLEDKKVTEWLNEFDKLINVWCISQVDSIRTMKTNDLLNALSNTANLITSYENVSDAFSAAKAIAKPYERIIVFGSFYTVGEVLAG